LQPDEGIQPFVEDSVALVEIPALHTAAGFELAFIGMGSVEVGYDIWAKLMQTIAIYFGLCGDPKIQIGLRYSIRL